MFLLASLVGCRSAEKAANAGPLAANIETSALLDSIASHEANCGWLSLKLDVEVRSKKFDDSFKMYVKMKADSAIWMSATYYAVEVARLLLTPDSVKYMDRRNNRYYLGNYSYLAQLIPVEADFGTVQNLLLANTQGFVNEQPRVNRTKNGYELNFQRGASKRRAEKDGLSTPPQMHIDVSASHFRPISIRVKDTDSRSGLELKYEEFTPICGSFLPNKMLLRAQDANEQLAVNTSVVKMEAGEKASLSFTIPEKYEPLDF